MEVKYNIVYIVALSETCSQQRDGYDMWYIHFFETVFNVIGMNCVYTNRAYYGLPLFFLFFICYAREQSQYDPWINTAKPLGKAYSFSTCNYKLEAGYTCLSCIRALHCYASNFAILVDCPLLFPYCRNGRCSRYEGAKCFEEKLSTSTIANILPDEYVVDANETVASSTNEDKVTMDSLEHTVQESEITTPETLTAEV